jgi:autophagy-related protein 16
LSKSTQHLLQILHDEINTLQLELGQIEERNAILTKDNAKLLQRWLDAKQSEANKMNEANEFYENMKSRHHAVLSWREGNNGTGDQVSSSVSAATSVSGNEETEAEAEQASTKDGIPSPPGKTVDLTPNG